ncbi:neutral zinc metallopeptidase [Pendulispora albinea]|uniref:Zinc metallopeptidase n=1 Tax=Pendulispora albinea TaxID=2741071 RepID=A0ABZ2LPU8_9BACT
MRWDEDHESRDVIDKRGSSDDGGGPRGPGLLGLLPLLGPLLRSPFGWIILLGIAGYYVVSQLGLFGGPTRAVRQEHAPGVTAGDPQKELVHFVSFVLDDNQETWTREFSERKMPYQRAKLVLFTNRTATGCGYGQSATGPFYCPADSRVYIDLGFYQELSGRLGARGQFAQAYVIAHEIGHHVQNLLGTEAKVQGRGGADKGPTSGSVRLELQADCYAGIWAHSTGERKLLEEGDIESAIGAATAIGDDRLQKMSTGTVSPERWTHGSSQQRVRWFKRGYETGKMESCDTFAAQQL